MHDYINDLSVFHNLHHTKCVPNTNIIESDKTDDSSEKLRNQILDSCGRKRSHGLKSCGSWETDSLEWCAECKDEGVLVFRDLINMTLLGW